MGYVLYRNYIFRDKMEFDFDEDLLNEAVESTIEMIKTGEVIRELKVGVFGRVYLSSDMEMVKWIKSFKVNEKMFFIGAKIN